VIVIGHRGAALCAPENTLAGLHYAGVNGIKQVECDISVAADDEAVVFHDERLDRLIQRPGTVLSQPSTQLIQYRVNGPECDGSTTIPHATAYLDVAAHYGLFVHLEIKVHDREVTRVVEASYRALAASRLDPGQVRVSSFSMPALQLAMQRFRGVTFGLAARRLEDVHSIVPSLGELSSLHLSIDGATQAEIDAVHGLDLPIYYYTVNTPDQLDGLDRNTVDGVFSDDPRRLLLGMG